MATHHLGNNIEIREDSNGNLELIHKSSGETLTIGSNGVVRNGGEEVAVLSDITDFEEMQVHGNEWHSNTYALSSALNSHTTDEDNPHSVEASQVGAPTQSEFDLHAANEDNPHNVDASQVGAVSETELNDHTTDTSNPHSVTSAQVGAPSNTEFSNHTGDTSNPHSVTNDQVNAPSQTEFDDHTSADNPHNVSEGLYSVVDTVNDTDGTTPLDVSLTVSNPQDYQTYRLMGYIWGSNYSQGEGGEIDINITVNDYTEAIYEYNIMDGAATSWTEGESQWVDKIWRRYKNPIDYTISADSDPVTTSDGNDSMFTTITRNTHQGRRGLLNGRMGGGWVDGGHPFGPLNSIEISSADDLEAKLVLYGMDWKGDL